VDLRDLTALAALLISGGALVLSAINYKRARRLDERDLFLRMHESLLDPEVVAGRRLLYKITTRQAAEQTEYRPAEMTQIYRALAMYDLLGLYVENGWIDEATVIAEWGHSLARSVEPARTFIEWRKVRFGSHDWEHFTRLAAKAQGAVGTEPSV
jgi:hypothetical protein